MRDAHRGDFVERRIDRAGIARPDRRRPNRGPVRPLGSGIAIPLGISGKDRTAFVGRTLARASGRVGRRLRFLAAAIGIVGVVAPLEPRRIDHHLDNVVLRLRVVAEIPQAETVVAIDRFDHIGAGVELHAHLSEVVAKQPADAPAQRNIVEMIQLGGKKRAAFVHEAVGVGIIRIEQRARQPRQAASAR